jgi:hypothetical protein
MFPGNNFDQTSVSWERAENEIKDRNIKEIEEI